MSGQQELDLEALDAPARPRAGVVLLQVLALDASAAPAVALELAERARELGGIPLILRAA